MSFDYALYEASYANVILYSATLPSYDNAKSDNEKNSKGPIVNASDPKNNDEVYAIFHGFKF